jgi:hypothetical protein
VNLTSKLPGTTCEERKLPKKSPENWSFRGITSEMTLIIKHNKKRRAIGRIDSDTEFDAESGSPIQTARQYL